MIGPDVGHAKYQQSHTACSHVSSQKPPSINSVKGRTDIVIQKVNRTACWQLSNSFGENFTKNERIYKVCMELKKCNHVVPLDKHHSSQLGLLQPVLQLRQPLLTVLDQALGRPRPHHCFASSSLTNIAFRY